MSEAKIPKTLVTLFAEVESVGGQVTRQADRLWWVYMPRKLTDGSYSMTRLDDPVGYYFDPRDGKNHIRNTRAVREAVARRTRHLARRS